MSWTMHGNQHLQKAVEGDISGKCFHGPWSMVHIKEVAAFYKFPKSLIYIFTIVQR